MPTITNDGYNSNNNQAKGILNITGNLTNLISESLDNLFGINQTIQIPETVQATYKKIYGTSAATFKNAEYRARNTPYTDPLQLNFKLMIDWNKSYGLFASEEHINSAGAYIKRIFGEASTQYALYKNFYESFKEFIQNYDFLILGCDGLQEAYSYKPGNYPIEGENNITLIVRETVLFQFTYILDLYRKLWYDEKRGVEILPANLRRFDCWILVYQSGYYNMLNYQYPNVDDGDYMTKLMSGVYDTDEFFSLPTLKKLSELDDKPINEYGFNNIIFNFYDAQLVPWESGKNLFADMSNEPNSDFGKSNLTFSYRFTNSDSYNKGLSLGYIMTIIASESKKQNENTAGDKMFSKGWLKQFASEWGDQALQALKDVKNQQLKNLKNNLMKTVNGLIGKGSKIGNALDFFTSPSAVINFGSDLIGDSVWGSFNKLNQLVSQNFSDTIISEMAFNKPVSNIQVIENETVEDKSYKPSNDVGVLEQPEPIDWEARGQHYVPEEKGATEHGIIYRKNIGNVFKRDTF